MRVAVVSDIHGNLTALDAVLEATTAAAVDEVWCLGDIVGYGARPNECAARVRERCTRVLAGNHDLAVVRRVDVSVFTEDAARSIRWTREVLRADTEAWLTELPVAQDDPPVGLYHASPRDPVWEYVVDAAGARAALETAADDRLVLVGHTHVAILVRLLEGRLSGGQAPGGSAVEFGADGRSLVNPGSVGQPRDGDPRAAWLLLQLDDDGLPTGATFERTTYEVSRTQEEIRAAGLPERLAARLAVGL
jgi:diadenosine tetraphosphatase ApaH/serine/threonine PP2A family protein phosphatase